MKRIGVVEPGQAIQLDVNCELNSTYDAHIKNGAGLGQHNRRRIDPNVEDKENSPSICCAVLPTTNKCSCAPARALARTEKHMHFALLDNVRTAPSPGLTGSCPVCSSAMIAKCGNQRVHHWAHRTERVCDSWWEPETPWHRNWKSKFPDAWQEVIRLDPSGEKHIADVHTAHGLTIEFQHSHLRPEERAAREKFYGNLLVWVVDGARLTRDLPRFREGTRSFRIVGPGLHITPFPDEAFPRSWLDGTVPMFFDFENAASHPQEAMHVTSPLWCLLPGRALGQAVVARVSRESFVRWMHEGQLIQTQAILANVERFLLSEQRRAQAASLRVALHSHAKWRPWGFRRRSRRF